MALDLRQVPVTKVTVTGHAVAFPPGCCCCGQPATREMSISATKNTFVVVATLRRTLTLSVPCCQVCGPRMEWLNQGGLLGLIPKAILWIVLSPVLSCVVTFPLVLLLGFVGVSGDSRAAIFPYAVGAAALALLAAVMSREVRKRPKGVLGPPHTCDDLSPVYLKRFDANSMTLNFLNDQVARAFAAANAEKVVKTESSTMSQELKLFG